MINLMSLDVGGSSYGCHSASKRTIAHEIRVLRPPPSFSAIVDSQPGDSQTVDLVAFWPNDAPARICVGAALPVRQITIEFTSQTINRYSPCKANT